MKNVIFALALGFAFAVQADYIYWMLDSTTVNVTQFDTTVKSETWDTAILSYDGQQIGSMTSSQWSDLDDIGAYAYATYDPKSSPVSTDTTTFMIELYSSGKWLGKTESQARYLEDYIFGNNSMSTMPAQGFGQGATYAVPEPTSGLLFVLGGMLLGLKRRRQKV